MKKLMLFSCAVLTAVAIAYATDRNADVILGVGGAIGRDDGNTSYGGLANAEFALSKDKTWSFLIGGSGQKINNDFDEVGFDLGFGIKKYLLPETSIALVGGVGYARGKVDEVVGVATPRLIVAMAFDYTLDALAPYAGLQLKQRLLPADNIISPYLGVSALVSKPEVSLDGDVEFLAINNRGYYIYARDDADDVIEYDYDPRFHLVGSAGMDINLHKNVGLVIGFDYGKVFSRGNVKFGNTKEDFNADFTFWQVSSGLKFYF